MLFHMADAIIPLGQQGSNITIPYLEFIPFSKVAYSASFKISISIPSYSFAIIQFFNFYNNDRNWSYYQFAPLCIMINQTMSNPLVTCAGTGTSLTTYCSDISSIKAASTDITISTGYTTSYFSGYLITCEA